MRSHSLPHGLSIIPPGNLIAVAFSHALTDQIDIFQIQEIMQKIQAEKQSVSEAFPVFETEAAAGEFGSYQFAIVDFQGTAAAFSHA